MTDAKPVADLRRIALKGETYGERLAALNELADRAEAAERERDDFKMQAEAQSDRNEDLQRERDEAWAKVKRLTDSFAGSFNLLPGEK